MASYNKQNPFYASIKERYSLCKQGSDKNTQHLVLDLGSSAIQYEVGDSVGIFSHYDHELISKTVRASKAKGDEIIYPKHGGEATSIYECFKRKLSVSDVPLKLLKEVYSRQRNKEKKEHLEELLKEDNHHQLKQYLADHEVWDFLETHNEVHFTPQELSEMLMPLLPRFYSIASSQKYVGNEIHLTVAPLEYESRGHRRRGVCTHYLCNIVELNDPVVPIFIQPAHNFRLPPERDISVIMIGPGTGIAPFRAFMQERSIHGSQGKNWIFFGEWNRNFDFFYENDWRRWTDKGHLRVDTAFSRDQKEKVYVQHKMAEHGQELFDWIDKGAFLYVCGNADRMAKDVDATLHSIIEMHGKRDHAEAKHYVKELRKQKRYLRDVY